MAESRKAKMTDDELLAIIESRKSSGLNYRDGELSTKRIGLLNRYLGKPYGNERDGQSKVVTRQCLEAVEWTLPSLLRVFMASPTIVEFEPQGAADEAAAKQETEALNYIFLKKNDGFMTLYTWIKDTLMNPVGYVKVYWDESQTTTEESYEGLLAPQVQELLDDDNVEIIEQDEYLIYSNEQSIPLFNVKVRITHTDGKAVVEPVPPEELVVDGKLNKVSLESADYINHANPSKTRSDLIEMGFDEDTVYALPAYSEISTERSSRHNSAEESGSSLDQTETSDASMELVELNETYIKLDYDGDGVAELRQVFWAGDTVLENEPAEMIPFVAMTAIPLPHTHVGISWMELVEDLQRINTTVTRQLLNNMYRTNNPRTVVGRGVNLSDLLNDLPNAPIRAQNIDQLRTEPTAPIIGQVLPAFGLLDGMAERRTGVTKRSMGLDADTLSRVNESAFLGTEENANQRLESLARIMSESGIKQLFLKLHQLLLTHQQGMLDIKIQGGWAQVDPSEWRERDDMTCMVGLGTGNKQGQMLALQKVQEIQAQLATSPDMSILVDPQKVYNSSAKMVEVAGLHSPDSYFNDPTKIPPKPPEQPQEDPMIEVQRKLVEVEGMKVQLKAQTDMAKQQSENAKLQMQLAEKAQELMLKERDLERKEYEVMLKSELDQSKLDRENMDDLNQTQDAYREKMNE